MGFQRLNNTSVLSFPFFENFAFWRGDFHQTVQEQAIIPPGNSCFSELRESDQRSRIFVFVKTSNRTTNDSRHVCPFPIRHAHLGQHNIPKNFPSLAELRISENFALLRCLLTLPQKPPRCSPRVSRITSVFPAPGLSASAQIAPPPIL